MVCVIPCMADNAPGPVIPQDWKLSLLISVQSCSNQGSSFCLLFWLTSLCGLFVFVAVLNLIGQHSWNQRDYPRPGSQCLLPES